MEGSTLRRASLSTVGVLYLAALLILGVPVLLVVLGLIGVAMYLRKPRIGRSVGVVLVASASMLVSKGSSPIYVQAAMAIVLFTMIIAMMIPLGLAETIRGDMAVLTLASILLTLIFSLDLLLPPHAWIYEAGDIATRTLITPVMAAACSYAIMRLAAKRVIRERGE